MKQKSEVNQEGYLCVDLILSSVKRSFPLQPQYSGDSLLVTVAERVYAWDANEAVNKQDKKQLYSWS